MVRKIRVVPLTEAQINSVLEDIYRKCFSTKNHSIWVDTDVLASDPMLLIIMEDESLIKFEKDNGAKVTLTEEGVIRLLLGIEADVDEIRDMF